MYEHIPSLLIALLAFGFACWQTWSQRRDYREDRQKLIGAFLAREELFLDTLREAQRTAFSVLRSGDPVHSPASSRRSMASPGDAGDGAGHDHVPGDVGERAADGAEAGQPPIAPDDLEALVTAQQEARRKREQQGLARTPMT